MMREIKSVSSVRLMPNAHVLLRHFGGQLLGSATRSEMEMEIGYAGGLLGNKSADISLEQVRKVSARSWRKA